MSVLSLVISYILRIGIIEWLYLGRRTLLTLREDLRVRSRADNKIHIDDRTKKKLTKLKSRGLTDRSTYITIS